MYRKFGFYPTGCKSPARLGKEEALASGKGVVGNHKTRPLAFADRVSQVNRLMKGGLHYFKYAYCHQKLKELDGWVRNRLRYCIWKHWKKPEKRRRSFIRRIEKGQAYAWSRSRMGGWAIACSPIMRTTITLDRLKRRGYLSFVDYYHSIRVV